MAQQSATSAQPRTEALGPIVQATRPLECTAVRRVPGGRDRCRDALPQAHRPADGQRQTREPPTVALAYMFGDMLRCDGEGAVAVVDDSGEPERAGDGGIEMYTLMVTRDLGVARGLVGFDGVYGVREDAGGTPS